jgi:hypothetical protein
MTTIATRMPTWWAALWADHDASTPKTGGGNRTIPLGPTTVAALRSWSKTQLGEGMPAGAGRPARGEPVVAKVHGSALNREAFSNLW